MHRPTAGPVQDIYDFSLEDEEPQVVLGVRSSSSSSSITAQDFIRSEHEQAGLFCLDLTAPQKKKRKRCGACGPCMRKDNCGSCSNCLNRKIGHQICRLRKCDQLKRRKSSAEVENPEDARTRETVSVVGLVDGLRGGGQMEIGSHDRLEEGMLSKTLCNGLKQAVNEENTCNENVGGLAREQHQQSFSQPSDWSPEPAEKQSTFASRHDAWSRQSSQQLTSDVNMEDAKNLVDFSATVGSLPSFTNHRPSHTPSAQLDERFSQEMSNGGAELEQKPVAGEFCPPEDINTLKAALNKARHGHKPASCDCEGPDCPDYLEWLKKQIKLVANFQEKAPCKASRAASQPHVQQSYSQPQPQQGGGNSLCAQDSDSQPPVNKPSVPRSFAPLPPIPCSPAVLSIAKERNVSLQTAIAIEALTQLSANVQQSPREALPANQHLGSSFSQGMPQVVSSSPGSVLSSTMSPSVPTGNYAHQKSWEQQRPRSQGEAAAPNCLSSTSHYNPHCPSSKPTFSVPHSPNPNSRAQQWHQGTAGRAEINSPQNPWLESQARFMKPSQGSGDPVSELKQLLGDTSGKYTNSAFKFPLPHIKQEINPKDYLASGCGAVGQEGMLNGQQQFPGQQLSSSIRHSTQAALQQHLHHKRNLFANSPAFNPLAPMACQNLRQWWPQGIPEGPLVIKQEPKEPKKKKSAQNSPLLKQSQHGLYGPMGAPLPKPKQIVIKKHKLKASQSAFHPQSQISVSKTPLISPAYAPSLSQLAPSLHSAEAGLPLSQVAGAPAQSQESILKSTHSSSAPVSVPGPSTQNVTACSDPAVSNDRIPITLPQTATAQPTPPLTGLGNLDPKFEELIRQFEEEFGDPVPSASQAETTEGNPVEKMVTESQSNSGQTRPMSPSSKQPNNSSPESVPMDVNQKDMVEGVKESRPVAAKQLGQVKEESETCNIDVNPSGKQLFAAQNTCQEQQDQFTTPFSPPLKRVKIEQSGGVTVLSTTANFSAQREKEDLNTPTKDLFPSSPSLKGFLESPLRYLDTPTKNLLNTPGKDELDFPTCDCVDQALVKEEGPYYNHLGSGQSLASIRELMEERYGEKGEAIRIEKVIYTGREGKSSQGCPIAKWVIRRGSEKEKILCVVKQRPGHHCNNTVIIVVIIAWEGVPRALGDKLYREVTETITKFGNATSRRCGLNDDRTCACQGKDVDTSGASFSFGCSWSMYFNGCKYARSKNPRKFRLQGEHPEEEEILRTNFQNLATHVAPLYKKLAPQAYSNQCANESVASDCRLGLKEGRPFSGITACMDFCAHAHKDQHNLHNGCTVVCTLTKEDNRSVGMIPEDEQLHVLPLYKVSMTDEFGSEENQRRKIQTGAIQVLNNFRREVRKLSEPAKSCRQRRLEAKKAASEKKNKKLQLAETPVKTLKLEMRHAESPQPKQGNKAIPKQEVKPTIKKEPVDSFQAFNGAVHGYPGNAAPDLHQFGYPGNYARGHMPTNGQPPAQSPVNGFHPNIQDLRYYNYRPKALFPPELLGYENGAWPKAGDQPGALYDQKPDVRSLQAKLAQTYSNRHGQSHPDMMPSGPQNQSELPSSPAPISRAPPASHEQMHLSPVIKQEPMDISLYDGQVQSSSNTPSTTPNHNACFGNKANGSLALKGWDGNIRSNAGNSPFTPDQQKIQQQHSHERLHYTQQWNAFSCPNTPMPSPAPSPSPSLKAGSSPAPSPRQWDSPAPSPQPKAWGPFGAAGFAVKQGIPDKMIPQAGENLSSAPLGLQEKAWKSGGGSVAGSTPSPAPEGRLFPDALQKLNRQDCWDSEAESQSERDPDEDEVWSDSEHNFLDQNIGGVAVAPGHGSILIECARRELHATTPLKKPDRTHPSRISLVFYQHKNLNQPRHGLALWEAKMKMLAERAQQRQQEAALLGLSQEEIKAYAKKRKWATTTASPSAQAKDKRDGVVTRMPSTQNNTTTTVVTVSPRPSTMVTGPYQRLV